MPEKGEAVWREFLVRLHGGETLAFERHLEAFARAGGFAAAGEGALPVWRPDRDRIERSNLGRLMRDRGLADYGALRRWSAADRGAFWEESARTVGLVWDREPKTMLDPGGDAEHAQWAPGARLNIAESCFAGPGDRPAIVSGGEGTERLTALTYDDLRRLTERVAGGLRRMGCRPGDAVALYMPMTAECVAAYLGILRAGCHAVSIADSFPASEVRKRLEIADAVAIVTVDRFRRAGTTIEMLAKVCEANAPPAIVVESGERGEGSALRDGDRRWKDFLGPPTAFPSVVCDPYDTINVLFSSGTTGQPKAIPWTHLTPLKCAVDARYHQDLRPADVIAWPTNIGWMMGPWLIFATLINGATMALFHGAPNGGAFVRFVERAGVTVLGVVPSLVRAWRAIEEPWPADWRRVRVYSSTGEPSGREDYLWLMSRSAYRAPIIEYCGGTEIGGAYITGTVVQPASPSTFTTPALGLDLAILDERGDEVAEGEAGEAFLIPPSIGLSERLIHGDHHAAYYTGLPTGPKGRILRRHGDRFVRLPGGMYRAQGRADDTMNLGGIKIGSLEIERVLEGHAAVRACAAIGVQPGGEGAERLVAYVVAEGPAATGPGRVAEREKLERELNARLATRLNPLFRLHDLVIADSLPYTASHKLMRRELKTRYVNRGESDRGSRG